jgi:hypothetical protein
MYTFCRFIIPKLIHYSHDNKKILKEITTEDLHQIHAECMLKQQETRKKKQEKKKAL